MADKLKSVLLRPVVVSLVLPFALVQLVGLLTRLLCAGFVAGGVSYTTDGYSALYGLVELVLGALFALALSFGAGFSLGFTHRRALLSALICLPVVGLVAVQWRDVSAWLGAYGPLPAERLTSCWTVALGAGLFEELAWRAGSVNACVRRWGSARWRWDACALVPAACFGAIHLANLLHGADPTYTFAQTFYTFGLGMTLGASYLRTRNLVVPLALHVAIDLVALLSTGDAVTSTINRGISPDVLRMLVSLGAALLAWGWVAIRPSKRAGLDALWAGELAQAEAMAEALGRKEMARAEEELVARLAKAPTKEDAMEERAEWERLRRRYRFVGQVQGVGFRFTITQLATGAGATGWVMNEPDGSVTAEVQGNEAQLAAVIQGLTQHFNTGRRWYRGFTIDDARDVSPIAGERDFRPIY